jgi:hypothetical protein
MPDTKSLVQLIGNSASGILSGFVPQAAIAAELIKIASAAYAAYQAETGEPLDPNKIQPIEEIL